MSASGRHPKLVAVWLVLMVLIGVILITQRTDRGTPQPERDSHGSAAAPWLLPVPMEQLGAIEVAHAGALHRFERDAAGDWFYHAHGARTGTEADHRHAAEPSLAARIAPAFAAFGRTRIERRFTLKTPATDYGIATPKMVILVYRPEDMQPLAQYAVGDLAPDTLSRYVLIVGTSAVVTIPNYQVKNLLALLEGVTGKARSGHAAQDGLR